MPRLVWCISMGVLPFSGERRGVWVGEKVKGRDWEERREGKLGLACKVEITKKLNLDKFFVTFKKTYLSAYLSSMCAWHSICRGQKIGNSWELAPHFYHMGKN